MASGKIRGADVLARAISAAGIGRLFALSGNHIMSVFDAALDAKLDIIHVRHEAAAVHMADAWGRLTGQPGIALLTGGPGHANGVSALYTALAAESPVVLLSGHASIAELGMGAFQEMRQAEVAEPLTKASLTAQSAETLGQEFARAVRTAVSGRPGPVHLSLPSDVLDAVIAARSAAVPDASAFRAAPGAPSSDAACEAVLAQLVAARRPLIVTGPAMMTRAGRALAERLSEAIAVPVVGMESPRGVGDPCLGAFAEMLAQADLLVLLGKPLDFTLKFGRAPALDANCKLICIDPDVQAQQRATRAMGARLLLSMLADAVPAAQRLIELAARFRSTQSGWSGEVHAAVRYRPPSWATLSSPPGSALHPVELCRPVQALLDAHKDSVLVSDGGEFGQWAQACLSAPERVINGVAGAIGGSLPFAAAARCARPGATVVALLGDGSFGFHMAEFDTAVRHQLPFIAVVGNDACWNAEHQIQLRSYGRERAYGCELLQTRYDLVAAALGGYGECVSQAAELPAALQRAVASGKPACVNVATQRIPAPNVTRATP